MDETCIERQREIGKQLFLVKIIQCETDWGRRGGFSFIPRNKIISWTSMSKEELDHFISLCCMLDPENLSSEAASDCCKEDLFAREKNAFFFVLHTYHELGEVFTILMRSGKLEDICEALSERNYKEYSKRFAEWAVDESFAAPKILEAVMRIYLRHFVNTVKEVVAEGYDWDVIKAMMRVDINEERFEELENAFG